MRDQFARIATLIAEDRLTPSRSRRLEAAGAGSATNATGTADAEGATGPRAAPRPPRKQPVPLGLNPGTLPPRRFGWITRVAPEARCGHNLLTQLFADPALLPMLAQSTKLCRMMRSLCFAFGKPRREWPPVLLPKPRSPATPPGTPGESAPEPANPPPAARPRNDLIRTHKGWLTPAQYRRSLGLPSKRPTD